MSYLSFEERPHPNKAAKTRCWDVRSAQHGFPLGRVSWFGRWRQYTFSPTRETTFNPACLRELADFCAERTAEHRALR